MRNAWKVLSLLTLLSLVLLGLLTGGIVRAQGPSQPSLRSALALQPLPTAVNPDTGEPVARFFLFFSPTCPHCHEVMENYLPTVYDKYGDQVEYQYFDLQADSNNYLTMLALEQKLGVPEDRRGTVPTLVIGDKVMIGGKEIPEELEGYIDGYLAQGGVDFPSLENLPEVVQPTPQPSVQVLLFVDSTHPDFEALSELMASLAQQYPDWFEPYAVDATVQQNADLLAQLNVALGAGEVSPGTPEVLVDHRLLVGLKQIKAQLPGLVAEYVAQGGVRIPTWQELIGGAPSATATPRPAATVASAEPIYVAYFEQAGCQECARTTYDLEVVKDQYPQLVVESFPIEEEESKALSEWLGDKYDVPEERRLSTPMLFVGDDVLIGTEASLNNLLAVVAKYAETGAERTWDEFDPEQGASGIVDRFLSFSVLTVLGAGLIDGLNPCAFATLVFFISYLAFTGRRGRDILFVGLSFTLGVFLTYLLVGVGLLRVVQSLGFFTTLGRWVYLLTALLCLGLAVLTFRDYFRARQGQATEMTLRLPMRLRRQINKVIRESAQVRAFVAMAFVTGFVVSLLELACTGQVYLPTIVYVMSQPELAGQAFLYLFLYCLMFILPLVVVFALSYFGTSSEQLGQFINRRTSTIKLITGLLFVALALWMTWTLAPLFAVYSPWTWVLLASVVGIIALAVLILNVVDQKRPKKPAHRQRRRRR